MSKIKCSVCELKGWYMGCDIYGDAVMIENPKSCQECHSTGEIEITDTMRLDFLTEHKLRLLTVEKVIKKSYTSPEYSTQTESIFLGWSAHNRKDELPTPREAISARRCQDMWDL